MKKPIVRSLLYGVVSVLMMEAYEAGMYGEFAPMKEKERSDLDPWKPTKDYIKERIESMFDAAGMEDLLYEDVKK